MFHAGQKIGNYNLVKPLGRGGFGEVWLAERETKFVTTKVAVKLPIRDVIDLEVIKQEAVLWEQASGHPNVVPIIDADEYDGQIVIVSEYAPDGTLEDLLMMETLLPVRKAVELSLEILRGLEFLHSRRIVHRDIKPENILMQGDTPRLTDFGMSRLISENSTSVSAYGTPYYMAPEAFRRKRNVQTDIWSFGVILYKMLSGRLPFLGKDVAELYAAVINDEPRPLPARIPARLQNIVMKALAKLPENRYASAAELRRELLDCLPAASAEKPPMDFYGNLLDDSGINTTDQPSSPVSATLGNLNLGATNQQTQTALPTVVYQTKPKRFSKLKILLAAGIALFMAAAVAGGFFFLYGPQPVPFRKNDKFGYSTWGKRIVIGAKYDLARPFSEKLGLVAVGRKNPDGNFTGKYGFIDSGGREVIPLEYDYADSFSGALALVGRLDETTRELKFGFIDGNGQEIIPLDYEAAGAFAEKLASVKFKNKWGVIDLHGNPVIPFKYDWIDSFSDGLAAVKTGDKYGFINGAGNEVIAPVYDFAGKFSGGVAPVKKNNKVFFIDAKGSEAIRFKYNNADSFSEGFALVTLNGKSGFIERSGIEVVACQYESEKSMFSEGLAAVKLNGRTGFINAGGRVVIPFKYADAGPLHNHLAPVKTEDGREFYVGADGTEFFEP